MERRRRHTDPDAFMARTRSVAAHLLGNDLIHGLDTRTHLPSWQWGLRVLWQHLSCM
jgi:hypothetical protein